MNLALRLSALSQSIKCVSLASLKIPSKTTTSVLALPLFFVAWQGHASNEELFQPNNADAEQAFLFDDLKGQAQIVSVDGVVRYEIRGEYAVMQGDIVLGKAKDLLLNTNSLVKNTSALSRGLARKSSQDRWPNGIAYYEFQPILDQDRRENILKAIDHWNEYSSITLIERTATIAPDTPDYIYFEAASGCASYVGRIGGKQELWVGSQCSTGSIIHEIGHAVGLFHEHTRPDRDNYISVFWDNIIEAKTINFDIAESHLESIGEYDYGSIMHYGVSFFSKDGSPTISAPDNSIIGQRKQLSEGDIAAVATMYATDLGIATNLSTNDDGSTQLDVSVSNQGTLGAHNISYVLPDTQELVIHSTQSEDFLCTHEQNNLECRLEALSASTLSNLTILLDPSSPTTSGEEAYLVSKTADLDTSNNGAVPEAIEEAVEENIDEIPVDEPAGTNQDTPDSEPEPAAENPVPSEPEVPSTPTPAPETPKVDTNESTENNGDEPAKEHTLTESPNAELQLGSASADGGSGALSYWLIFPLAVGSIYRRNNKRSSA